MPILTVSASECRWRPSQRPCTGQPQLGTLQRPTQLWAPPKWDARVAVAGITLLLHYLPADVPAVAGCAATASFSPSAPGQQDVPAGKAVPDEPGGMRKPSLFPLDELPPGPAANATTGGDDTDDEAYADATESLHSSAALRQSSGLGASAAFASGCGFPASPAALGGFGSDSVMFHSAAAAYDAAAAASAATTEDASEAATSRSVPEATAATDAAAAPAVAPEHMPRSQCEQPAGFFSRTAAASGLDGSAPLPEGSRSSAAGDGHHGSSPHRLWLPRGGVLGRAD